MDISIPQNVNVPQKLCGKCKTSLPATTEYFHVSRRGLYGLHLYCKICRNTPILIPNGYQQCANCKAIKSSDDFSFNKCHDTWYQNWCILCYKEKQTAKEAKRIEIQIEREKKLEELKKQTKQGRKQQKVTPCTKCGENDPSQFYYTMVKGERKKRKVCKKCEVKVKVNFINIDNPIALKKSDWAESHPDHYLRNRYNMSGDDYQLLADSQGNICKICGTSPEENKRLYVDHCHETGKIRGLLCDKCNRGIGFFRDNPAFLRKAAEYLEEE